MSGSGSGSDSIGIVSNLDRAPEAINLTPGVVPAVDVIEARKAAIGDGAEVRRLLPQRTLRTIGAWCFLDHYGPSRRAALCLRILGLTSGLTSSSSKSRSQRSGVSSG